MGKGMKEIELKFKLENRTKGDLILESPFVGDLLVSGSTGELRMEATYYDTPDGRLSRQKAAYRIRKENEACVATLKWSSKDEGGLSIRNECNVDVTGEKPDLSVFLAAVSDFERLKLPNNEALEPILITRFLRRRAILAFECAEIEMAVDEGEILAGEKSAPICELELELISGEAETLISLGKQFQRRFGLEPEGKSKFLRGMELMSP